jgi:hypothetical protein
MLPKTSSLQFANNLTLVQRTTTLTALDSQLTIIGRLPKSLESPLHLETTAFSVQRL